MKLQICVTISLVVGVVPLKKKIIAISQLLALASHNTNFGVGRSRHLGVMFATD